MSAIRWGVCHRCGWNGWVQRVAGAGRVCAECHGVVKHLSLWGSLWAPARDWLRRWRAADRFSSGPRT